MKAYRLIDTFILFISAGSNIYVPRSMARSNKVTMTILTSETNSDTVTWIEKCNTAGGKFYLCTMCNFSCLFPSQMKLHSRTHTGERPYKCNMCGKGFNRKDACKRHLYLIHGIDINMQHDGVDYTQHS